VIHRSRRTHAFRSIVRRYLQSSLTTAESLIFVNFIQLPTSRVMRCLYQSVWKEISEYRLLARITAWGGLFVLLILGGCSRNTPSKPRIELRDVPDASFRLQVSSDAGVPSCPPGDPVDNDASFLLAGKHSVNLSWNASASAAGANQNRISYCIYRTEGGPVRPSDVRTSDKSPCLNCERVTVRPVSRTAYRDTRVKNNVHYCYAAIAVESGNIIPSDFSNQADAVIPPRKEAPFCNVSARTAVNESRRKTRHR
jgi:hypothetical protein